MNGRKFRIEKLSCIGCVGSIGVLLGQCTKQKSYVLDLQCIEPLDVDITGFRWILKGFKMALVSEALAAEAMAISSYYAIIDMCMYEFLKSLKNMKINASRKNPHIIWGIWLSLSAYYNWV